jgi:hypothetical protein
LEVVEDDEPQPRPAPPRPGGPPAPEPEEEAVVLEEVTEEPALPPRKSVKEAITPRPAPRRKPHPDRDDDIPVLEAVEDGEEDRPSRAKPGKKRKKRRDANQRVAAWVWVVLVLIGLAWLATTPLAFMYEPVAFTVVLVGIAVRYVGRRGLSRLAHEEGGSEWLLMLLVPFYRFYFFFTHFRPALMPFLIWFLGSLFALSGACSLAIHRLHTQADTRDTVPPWVLQDVPRPNPSTPQSADAEATRLLAGNKKEARAWLREPENRRSRAVRALVEQAYDKGAKEVFVVGFDPDDEEELRFVVVLPADPAARRRLIDWHRESEPDLKDVGQKYLLLTLE